MFIPRLPPPAPAPDLSGGGLATRLTPSPAPGPTQAVCMAKKSKNIRVVVTLECTEQKESGVPGMSRYTTMKNRRNTPDRLEIKKYNKYLRRMTLHKEIKK